MDNRGSACGSDAQPDPPQIPVTEASQQDTVWRCLPVCGMGGFPFDLPDPHLLTKKNDPLFGSKGLALRAVIWHRMPRISRSGKEKKPKHSLRLFLSLFTFLFFQRQACRVPFSARGSIHLRGHASPRYAGIRLVRPLYQQVRSPFSTCHQTA